MDFGVFTVSMPEYDPEETARKLAELGYDGVEWRVAHFPDKKPAEGSVPYEFRYWAWNESTLEIDTLEENIASVKEMCDRYGLKIFSLTTYLKPNEIERIESVMRAAASIGVPKIRVFQDGYAATDEQKDYVEALNETRVNLRRLEKLSRRYGVKIMLEIHMDTLVSSPSAAWNLLSDFDPACIGVIFDPGNMVNEGYEDYQKSFELLGPYIAHVHVKNAVLVEDGRDANGSRKWKRQQAPLWDGMANLGELFRVMRRAGYDGTVSVEDFSNEQPTAEKLKANLEYLKKL